MRRIWVPATCAVVQLVQISSGSAHRHGGLVAVGSAVGLAGGISLAWRGRRPSVVLAATCVAYLAQAVLAGPVIPASAAVATENRTRLATSAPRSGLVAWAPVLAGLLAVSAAVTVAGSPFLAAPWAVLLLAAALLGQARAAAAQHEAAARRELVVAERLRIARDLHDVVGHGIGAITVQAGAARMALNADQPAEAAACLVTIENAGRSVLAEVRWLVGLLRDESSCPGLTELPDLVASARRSGLDVSLLGPDPLPDLPANLSETIYRTVQEALTNVVRHSGRRSAEVELSCADSAVSVLVRNDGTADGPDGLAGLEGRERQGERAVAGSGLRGMQERVTAAGGNLRFGPQPNGGWLVRASFPSPDHSTARTRRTRRQPGQLL